MSKFELPKKPTLSSLWRVLPIGTILWTVSAIFVLLALQWVGRRYHLQPSLVIVLKIAVVIGAGLRIIHDIETAMAHRRAQRLEQVGLGEDRVGTLSWGDTLTGIYVTRLLLYAALVLVAIFTVGGTFSGLVVGGTLISVMLGVAGQSFFANFFGGLAIALFKAFEVGDQIQIVAWQFPMMPETYPHQMRPQGYRGVVRDINLFYSELRLDEGPLLRIPNGVVITAGLLRSSPEEWARITFRFDLNATIDVMDVLAKMEAAAEHHFGPGPKKEVTKGATDEKAVANRGAPGTARRGWSPPVVLIVDMSPATVSVEVRGSVLQRSRDRAKADFFAELLPYVHPQKAPGQKTAGRKKVSQPT